MSHPNAAISTKAYSELRSKAEFLPRPSYDRPTDMNLAPATAHEQFWAKALAKSDAYDLESLIPGPYAKRHAAEARKVTAYMLTQALRSATAAEAQLAATDLPTFTTKVVLMVKRIYPMLFATQLFGVIPMSQPTARIWFKDYKYDDNFTGSSPTIAQGDRTDNNIASTFNVDYDQVDEGSPGRRIKFTYSHMDFSESSHRLLGDISDQFKDDVASVYGESDGGLGSLYMHMGELHARGIDRRLIARVRANIPAANENTWDATPAAAPDYSTLVPTEKKAYDETLWSAIQETIDKVHKTNAYSGEGRVEWIVCGTSAALRLWKLTSFRPVVRDMQVADLSSGALRDIGTIDVLGLRILVDPMLSTEEMIFGSKPRMGEPGIYFAPYKPYEVLRDSYDTDTGLQTIGVRSRYGIVVPNTGSNAASSRLADRYGRLTITP